MKAAAAMVSVAIVAGSAPAFAQSQRPPTSPESPAGYNVPVTPPPPTDPAERARIDDAPSAADGHPLAGYHNGLFYLRDHHDNFHLYIQGRSQIDFYSFLGAGVPETTLKPTLFLRRVRPEITGEFLGHWRFMVSGDFGATAIDNPRGTNQTAAAPPGVAPTASTARFASGETTRFQAAATDVFINYRQSGVLNVQIGQMDAPFSMENRTSDKFIPFMERSLAVRAVGIPTNKEIGGMAWGETSSRVLLYTLGVFNGDGQNRPNVDARFDAIGRVVVHPLATAPLREKTLKDMQVGVSGHYGSRDRKWVDYDYPTMSTQGSYAFWSPIYTSSKGPTHVIPAGDQLAVAGELRVPLDRFDLTSELVYIKNGTREAVEGFEAANTERFGSIEGISYYAMLGFWVLGTRDVNGVPGYGNPPRLDWTKSDPETPAQALQLLAKWEQVALKYDSASRGGLLDPGNIDGKIRVNALSFGVNYWATKHVRVSLNYVYDQFPGSAPVKPSAPGGPQQTPTNRAAAPGNTIAPGLDDRGRDNAHDLHELLARLAIAL
jgi:phosphate-selective porin